MGKDCDLMRRRAMFTKRGDPRVTILTRCTMATEVSPRRSLKSRRGVASARAVVERGPLESGLTVSDPPADVSLRKLESRGRESSPGLSRHFVIDESGANLDKGDNSPTMPVKNSAKNVLSIRDEAERPGMGSFSNTNP